MFPKILVFPSQYLAGACCCLEKTGTRLKHVPASISVFTDGPWQSIAASGLALPPQKGRSSGGALLDEPPGSPLSVLFAPLLSRKTNSSTSTSVV